MKTKQFVWICALAALMMITGSAARAQQVKTQEQSADLTSAVTTTESGCADVSGIPDDAAQSKLLANLDKSANPCQDFYHFADGGWLKANPIPPAYPRWGNFNVLQDHNQQVLKEVLEADAKANPPQGSNAQKVGDLYDVCMNVEAIDKQGTQPLDKELEQIAAVKDLAGVEAQAAHLQMMGVNVLFEFGSDQDFKDSTQVIGEASQGGLGMPDRDYYTKTDDKSKTLRDQYVAHVAKMFTLLGDAPDKAQSEAQTVLTLETEMARASMTRVERRDPDANYHPMDRTQLNSLTRNFSWDIYLEEVGAPPVAKVNVGQPDFFKALDAELAATPIDDWKMYLRWHLIHASAPALSQPFVDENFNFYNKTLHRLEGNSAALEALRDQRGRPAGRGAGPGICTESLSARSQGAGAGHGAQPDCRAARRHYDARLDGAGNARSRRWPSWT